MMHSRSEIPSWVFSKDGTAAPHAVTDFNQNSHMIRQGNIDAGSKPDQAEQLPALQTISRFFPAYHTPRYQPSDLAHNDLDLLPRNSEDILLIDTRRLVIESSFELPSHVIHLIQAA